MIKTKKSTSKIHQYIARPRNVVVGISLVGILSLILMIFTLFVGQQGLKEKQDIRQQASDGTTATSKVEMVLEPLANKTFVKDQPTSINILVNTHQLQTTGLQWIFSIDNDSSATGAFLSDLKVVVDPTSKLTNQVNIETRSDSYLVKLYAFALPGQPFSSSQLTKVGTISFTPTRYGKFAINTDNAHSYSTIYGVTPPDDRLQEILSQLIEIVVSPPVTTVTPVNTPTVIPTTINSPTPMVTHSPTPTPGTGGTEVVGCNEICTSHNDCEINNLCYTVGSEKRCRLSTNPTSSTCQGLPDQGLSASCNQYCADSMECSDGLTCWYNQCRLASNISSTTCAPLTQTQIADQSQLCDIACNSNDDCAVNLRCYQGACRLAVNPTSPSCSLPPIKLPAAQPTALPKGAVVVVPTAPPVTSTPKPDPKLSDKDATDSAVVAEVTAEPDNKDATDSAVVAEVTPTPVPPVQPNALSELVANLQQSGRLLPVGVLVVGAVLLLSSILAGMFGSKPKTGVVAPPRRTPPQQPTTQLPSHNAAPTQSNQTTQPTSNMAAKLKSKGVEPPHTT